MKKKNSRLIKKILWIFLIIVVIGLIAFLFIVPHMIFGDMVNKHIEFNKMMTAEEYGLNAEKVKLETDDGLNIIAYDVKNIDKPKAIAILLSGIHKPSVTAFYDHAKLLAQNGYGSLLVEMRAHGESEGNEIGLGFKEYKDVKAAVEYIKNQYGDIPVVIIGISMGGATAINSVGKIDEIDGVVSVSAFSSCTDLFYDNMIDMGAPKLYSKIQKPFVTMYLLFKYGFDTIGVNPKQQIENLGNRPALIIHSKEDSQIPFESFERIMKRAPEHVESIVIEGDKHILNIEEDKGYSDKLIEFFRKNF